MMFAHQQALRGSCLSARERLSSGLATSTSPYCSPIPRPTRRQQRCSVRSQASSEPGGPDGDDLKRKFFKDPAPSQPVSPSDSEQANNQSFLEGLDAVNPYTLGRQARQAFDDVWTNISRLSSPTRSFVIDDVMEPGRDADFEAPQAAFTTVLVVGATGRVGRILLRKLLLRGYTVKALVRQRDGNSGTESSSLPAAVQVIKGDVGDMNTCQEAVKGVNKVCSWAEDGLEGTRMACMQHPPPHPRPPPCGMFYTAVRPRRHTAPGALAMVPQPLISVPAGNLLRRCSHNLHSGLATCGRPRRDEHHQGDAGKAQDAASLH